MRRVDGVKVTRLTLGDLTVCSQREPQQPGRDEPVISSRPTEEDMLLGRERRSMSCEPSGAS